MQIWPRIRCGKSSNGDRNTTSFGMGQLDDARDARAGPCKRLRHDHRLLTVTPFSKQKRRRTMHTHASSAITTEPNTSSSRGVVSGPSQASRVPQCSCTVPCRACLSLSPPMWCARPHPAYGQPQRERRHDRYLLLRCARAYWGLSSIFVGACGRPATPTTHRRSGRTATGRPIRVKLVRPPGSTTAPPGARPQSRS